MISFYYKKTFKLIQLKIFFFIYLLLDLINIFKKPNENNKKQKVGVISCNHCNNIGNNLVKFSMFIILSKYGSKPEIIGTNNHNFSIRFLEKHIKVRTVKNFSEIKKNDYDILIVNSDQSWRNWNKDFYDIAFLKFANNWNITKFTYGVSLGFINWKYSKKDEKVAKQLLKNFTGISVREKNSVELIKKKLDLILCLFLN